MYLFFMHTRWTSIRCWLSVQATVEWRVKFPVCAWKQWCMLVPAEACPQATHRSLWTSGCGILETGFPLEHWWCVAEDGPCMMQTASPVKTDTRDRPSRRHGKGTRSSRHNANRPHTNSLFLCRTVQWESLSKLWFNDLLDIIANIRCCHPDK